MPVCEFPGLGNMSYSAPPSASLFERVAVCLVSVGSQPSDMTGTCCCLPGNLSGCGQEGCEAAPSPTERTLLCQFSATAPAAPKCF